MKDKQKKSKPKWAVITTWSRSSSRANVKVANSTEIVLCLKKKEAKRKFKFGMTSYDSSNVETARYLVKIVKRRISSDSETLR